MDCRVCSSPASGFHYKITTCRACAAFFRRTLQLKLRYYCQENGNCYISEDCRFNCKQCRLKKCLAVGMTAPEGEDLEFLESCINDPQTSFYTEEDFFSPEYVFNNEKFSRQLKKKAFSLLNRRQIQDSCDIFITKQADAAYKFHEKQYPYLIDTLVHSKTLDLCQKMISFYKELLILAEFCSRIRPFSRLQLDQKAIIFKNYFIKFINLDRSFVGVKFLGNDRNDMRIVTLCGKIWDIRDHMSNLQVITDLAESDLKRLLAESETTFVERFHKPFKVVKPDRFELLYLLMYTLFDTRDLTGITPETKNICEGILEKLGDELQFYYKNEVKLENSARRIYKLHGLLSLLDRLVETRKKDYHLSRTFEIFKMEIHWNDFDLSTEAV